MTTTSVHCTLTLARRLAAVDEVVKQARRRRCKDLIVVDVCEWRDVASSLASRRCPSSTASHGRIVPPLLLLHIPHSGQPLWYKVQSNNQSNKPGFLK